jgi:hypothetical protein
MRDAILFNSYWNVTTVYNDAMQALVSTIPKSIEKVTWGLTKEQKEVGDYGGCTVAKDAYCGRYGGRMLLRREQGVNHVQMGVLKKPCRTLLGARVAIYMSYEKSALARTVRS